MNVKLDENLSHKLKAVLHECGHNAETVADEGLIGNPDFQIAEAARLEGRMLFSLDLAFANVRTFSPGTHPGIIVFRPRSLGPAAAGKLVEAFVRGANLDELAGCIVVVEPVRVRVRWPQRAKPD